MQLFRVSLLPLLFLYAYQVTGYGSDKEGKCPPKPADINCTLVKLLPPERQCFQDLECNEGEKCCEIGCDRYVCTPAIDLPVVPVIGPCSFNDSSGKGDCQKKNVTFCDKDDCTKCCHHSSTCSPQPGVYIEKEECGKVQCQKKECYGQGRICIMDKYHRAKCTCPQGCPKDYVGEPICGSDNIDYDNECEMNLTACVLGGMITIKNKGSCKDCSAGKARGYGEEIMVRWNYDQFRGVCSPFLYHGNGGNTNNFETRKECEKYCAHRVKNVCQLPKVVGVCRQSIPRWYFNKARGACEKFIYGGCFGNANNFKTLEDCRDTCTPHPCGLPKETGDCRAYFPNFYYNSTTKLCEPFVYGGCGGNANRFGTIDECVSACGDEQSIPGAPGTVPTKPCPEACVASYQPVCGSNDQTYPNLCVMHADACRKGVLVIKKKDGPCESEPEPAVTNGGCSGKKCDYGECVVINGTATCQCRKACPFIYLPVCGSDKQSYDNMCLLDVAACDKKQNITVLYEGKCDEPIVTGARCLGENKFTCRSIKKCIPLQKKCDGIDDCGDNSDEEACETKCEKEVREANEKQPIVGLYIPQCEDDGSYKEIQCHGSIGECWCVDDQGVEVDGTRVNNRVDNKQPECGQKETKCEKEVREANEKQPIVGLYIPQCEDDGSYKDIQCHGSIGECWCVDDQGVEVDGTRVNNRVDNKQPECGKKDSKATKCQLENKVEAMPGRYIPQCEDDGSYKEIQCHGSIGECWCVDDQGVEVDGTRVNNRVGNKQPECGQKETKCEKEVREANEKQPIVGLYIPQCEDDGSYKEIQCHGSIGECWCVDDQGVEVDGTRVNNRVDNKQPECGQKETKCEKEVREANEKQPIVGLYIPQCEDDGSYKDIQCHGSIGECWCVDDQGVEVDGTRVNNRVDNKQPECGKKDSKGTKCQLENKVEAMPGRYIPQCEDDGSYKEIQCHGSIGECWCVDDQGVEVDGTRVNNRVDNKQPECGQKETKCEKEVREANEKQPIVGLYIPQCEDDGSYKDIQCHGSIGECWCVDDQGVEFDGTRVNNRVDNKQPECGKKGTSSSIKLIDICEVSLCDFGSCVVRNGSATCECFEGCTLDYNPVCASNNVTYPNYCAMELDACKKKERLSMQYEAECGSQPESKCEKEVREANEKQPIVGLYIPQCKDDGSYKDIQCHGSIGECWCVDDQGVEVDGTRVNNRVDNKQPECGKKDSKATKCQLESNVEAMPGRYIPQCEDDGSYKEIQCHGSIGECWCVDDQGVEVDGTRVNNRVDNKQPECGKKDSKATKCQLESNVEAMPGRYIPQCEDDGSYKEIQCHGSIGECWCVDDQGVEVDGTRVNNRVDNKQPECGKKDSKATKCQLESNVEAMPGRYIPQCEDDGSYKEIQCHGSIGECWCVDDQGVEVDGTRVNNRVDNKQPQCGKKETKCEKEVREANEKQPIVGLYIPQCEDDGSYKDIQCHGSIGECWCVDDQGVEVDGTRVNNRVDNKQPECGKKDSKATKCQLESNVEAMPGRYIPQCEDDGSYKEIQCHGSIGECWCVDDQGVEVDGTRVNNRVDNKQPECGKKDSKATKCQLESNVEAMPGRYIPQCEDDGSYKEIQCHGSIGECWCVDDQGVEVDGTRVNNRVDNKQPQCGKKETKCEKEVREANEKQPIVGLYIPQCEDDGSYKDIQCHGSIGECWCVDDQGVEVDGTRVNNRVDNKQPECGKKGTNSSTNLFDICEISLCDFGSCVVRNGSATCECFEGCTLDYNPVCASNNVTYPNYCAMELDACKKKERLSMQYEAECGSQPDSKATKCQLENKVKAIPGRYIPQCEDDGSYKRKQCHGSTGQCWCVDTDGNKLAETVVNFTQPNCEPTKGVTTATTTNEGTANTVLFGDECDRKLCEFGHCVDINGVATCQCEQPCTRIVLILCGTDNVTYDNYCTMEVAACKQKKHIAAQYLSKCGSKPQTKCEKHREKAQNAGVVAGRFIPSCEEDGSYSTAQCHGSTGFCWCSDDQGNEIDNTRVRFKLPLCNASRPVDPCSSKECKQGHCVNVNGVAQCQCYEQCSDEMHLACGTDNKTYYNPCYLKVKNCKKGQSTSVQHMGPCYIPPIQPVGTHCQRERQIASEIHPKRVGDYIPQCKEDGKYFKKQCRPALGYCWCVNEDTGVKVNGTQDVASKVNCQQNSTVAVIDYDICDITLCDYGRCVNVNGKAVCQCRKGCPKILRPVCGTDGKTYDNICLLEVEACEQKKRTGVDYEGPCKGGENSISKPDVCATVKCSFGRCVEINGSAVCNCERPCPRIYDPYCGSDNKTYDNKCILAVESCKQKKTITIQYRGRCDPCIGVDCQYNSKCQVVEGKAKCQCQLQCPANIDWKCGSDGKLYSNECELKHAACTNMKNIDIVDITKCQERVCQACPSVSEISIEKRYCRTKNDFAIIGKVVSLAKYTSYYELNVTVRRRFKPRQPSKKVTLKRDETITIKFSPIAPDCRCKDIEKLVVNTKAIFIGQLDGDGNTVVAMKPSSFVQVVRKGLVQKLWRLKSTKGRSICRRFSL